MTQFGTQAIRSISLAAGREHAVRYARRSPARRLDGWGLQASTQVRAPVIAAG